MKLVPDIIEKLAYVEGIHLILKILEKASKETSIDLIGHRLRFIIEPTPEKIPIELTSINQSSSEEESEKESEKEFEEESREEFEDESREESEKESEDESEDESEKKSEEESREESEDESKEDRRMNLGVD